MEGRIIKVLSDLYIVKSDKRYEIKARGKLRNDKVKPLVGDIVSFDEMKKVIFSIKPRKNYLVRPPVSNIDQVIIITSVKEPDFSPNLLDKLLVIIEFNKIKPIICLSKMDLLTEEETLKIQEYKKYYEDIGYQILFNTELEKLKKLFKNKVSIFAGQSGVGKSSLLNKLDKELNLKTNEISKSLGRGKHTTRHVELLEMHDGLVADTPGFSALDFIDMTDKDIRDNFIEFEEYKTFCKYRDCMHINEPDCKLRLSVKNNKILKSRYQNYLKFIQK